MQPWDSKITTKLLFAHRFQWHVQDFVQWLSNSLSGNCCYICFSMELFILYRILQWVLGMHQMHMGCWSGCRACCLGPVVFIFPPSYPGPPLRATCSLGPMIDGVTILVSFPIFLWNKREKKGAPEHFNNHRQKRIPGDTAIKTCQYLLSCAAVTSMGGLTSFKIFICHFSRKFPLVYKQKIIKGSNITKWPPLEWTKNLMKRCPLYLLQKYFFHRIWGNCCKSPGL